MDSYPKTKLYETSLKNGLKPLDTLADWGEFDEWRRFYDGIMERLEKL